MSLSCISLYLNKCLLVGFRTKVIKDLFSSVKSLSALSPMFTGAVPSLSVVHYHELNELNPSLYAVSRNSAPPARFCPGPRLWCTPWCRV